MSKKIDDLIIVSNNQICENLEKFKVYERGQLSQNILIALRNFVDAIILKEFSQGKDIEIDRKQMKKALNYVKVNGGKLKFLSDFHNRLNSSSHFIRNKKDSEILLLFYYKFLVQIKNYMNNKYNMKLLKNLEKFPINFNLDLQEYYEKISEKILLNENNKQGKKLLGRYYIEKIKPFFVKEDIFYELSLREAYDVSNKFDRSIAFTKLNLSKNYSVTLSVFDTNINILDKNLPIKIIDDFSVSIRPAEFSNFFKIFGEDIRISDKNNEYKNLMNFLTKINFNLLDLIKLDDYYYNEYKNYILRNASTNYIFNGLEKARKIIKNNQKGSNVLRYLIFSLKNNIIKKQLAKKQCSGLSNLYLLWETKRFDDMPFAFSLKGHNPEISVLIECIDYKEKNHEFLARIIKNNSESKNMLYTNEYELTNFTYDNIMILIQIYNASVYKKNNEIKNNIENYKNNFYINSYDNNSLEILNKLKYYSNMKFDNYSNSVLSWIKNNQSYKIDSSEKKEALINMYENSTVALVYGPAGTGKTTFIQHVVNILTKIGFTKIIFLAVTNTTVDNLKRKNPTIARENFMTFSSFLHYSNVNINSDLLVIDECGSVSNDDMLKVLYKAKFSGLILCGDTYQLESIKFGNWFNFAKYFLPNTSIINLKNIYRTENNSLLKLWEKVRNNDELLIEELTNASNNYSENLLESIFSIPFNNDEIVLSLNYDGLYGINNLNTLLQSNNTNKGIELGLKTYKINDPILFNESNRFHPLIYNNLKGKIVDINEMENKIQFDIELEISLNEYEVRNYSDLKLLDNPSNSMHSIIRFNVENSIDSEGNENNQNNLIPFQVSYAISIHKAQGLEYDSVRIVVTDEIEDDITSDVFYTAITRTKNNLKIYWTSETASKIIANFYNNSSIDMINNDIKIFKEKHNL